MSEQVDYINNLINKYKDDEFGPDIYLVHATFNTMEIKQLVSLYIDTKNLELKNTLDYHLKNRFKESSIEHKKLFNSLMNKIKNVSYKQRQRIRVLLSYLITQLPIYYTQKFFDFFSLSKYANDISAALKVSNLVWNNSSGEIFMNKFIETGNEGYLIGVINNGEADVIAKKLNEFWEEDYPANYLKNKIIRKISPEYFEILEFLKDSEPDKYLYACAFANVKLNNGELEMVFQDLNSNQKAFGLWCIWIFRSC